MELSLQVKGQIQRCISVMFSWDKLYEFGTSIGVDTKLIRGKHEKGPDFDPNWSKKKVAAYIIENSDDEGEFILKTLISMSKKGTWDNDYSQKVVKELNPVLERTMKIRVDTDGNIEPLFDELKDIPSRIPKKLRDMGFDNESADYEKAYKGYQNNDKGSISTIRTVIEGVSKSIVQSKGITVYDQMATFIQLEKLGILKEIDKKQCSKCGFRKKDLELLNAYNIYSLLSHYGNHTGELTNELAEYLFISASSFIWFLIKRYEKI